MTKNSKDIFLLASVFITGFSVLILEIVATRILSPYYGNTIYTTSSVIGIVLFALALGYYFGGKFSDKYPSFVTFYLIIFSSGIFVLLTYFWGIIILKGTSAIFSIVIGPLISSLLIFFVPSFWLAMLSPFAVKLHQKEFDSVGSKSGEVFFWSTAGSIAGSLLTGFVFIPHLGVSNIIIATGLFVTLWGALGMFFCQTPEKKKALGIWLVLIFLGMLAFSFIIFFSQKSNALYEKDGRYEKIKIINGLWNNRPVRFLMQDRSNSAAMYLDSDELAYDYTKYYLLYQLINPEATQAFLIGGGAYSIPKALLKDSPKMQVVVTEIEPDLYNLAQKYFNLKPEPRLKNITEDGRQFLSNNAGTYDIMVSDVYYSFFSIPIHFTTQEFFTLAKSRLNENGVFIGNFAGDLKQASPSFIMSEIKTFKKVFPNSYFFAVNDTHSELPQNIIFLGINGSKTIDFAKAQTNTNPILKNLTQKNIDISKMDFSDQLILTDDFSPVEYLASRVFSRWY
jgi:predicted membrane-bound spermidine synthase